MNNYGPLFALFLLITTGSTVFAQDSQPIGNDAQEMTSHSTFLPASEWQEKWDNSLAYSLETLETVKPEDLDFKPSADQMTLREQFHHMSMNVYFLTSRYLSAPEGFDVKEVKAAMKADASKEDIAATLSKAYAFGRFACEKMEAKDWDLPVPDFFAGPKTKRVILNLLQDHATHHRAQTLVYLRLLGHKPPRYRGW